MHRVISSLNAGALLASIRFSSTRTTRTFSRRSVDSIRRDPFGQAFEHENAQVVIQGFRAPPVPQGIIEPAQQDGARRRGSVAHEIAQASFGELFAVLV